MHVKDINTFSTVWSQHVSYITFLQKMRYSLGYCFRSTWIVVYLTMQDAPVECNRAFINRFETVFHEHILSGNRILGDVVDYAIRYECQGRGSLHVHMCIWLRTLEDVAALDERIRANVPAEQDANGNFILPEDPLQRRLYRCVLIGHVIGHNTSMLVILQDGTHATKLHKPKHAITMALCQLPHSTSTTCPRPNTQDKTTTLLPQMNMHAGMSSANSSMLATLMTACQSHA